MSDLIERKAAINAISCDITITGRQNAELVAATIGAFADRIKALPSVQPEITVDGYADGFADGYKQGQKDAQPERKTGNWNVIQGNIVVCSECGMCAPKTMTGCLVNRHLESNRTNFCPNCGADMRGKQDERFNKQTGGD